jgi:asparagine synthase (glutamine-hydrolysing)
MCGISCIVSERKLPNGTLESFRDFAAHRGPDSAGLAKFQSDFSFTDEESDSYFIGLAHRRLSILDLSAAGTQPMVSDDSNYIISYNGEVYNYLEIKNELLSLGYVFKTSCDTEVVLNSYIEWGNSCFSKFNGMWALVILDRVKKNLVVSRDRLGIKPLYYSVTESVLAFGSEIKQFKALEPIFSFSPNSKACVAYLVNGYEIPPETFIEGINVFPAASYAEIPLNKDKIRRISTEKYWDPHSIQYEKISSQSAIEKLNYFFKNAVKLRLRSDVPVGTCLSGGLDSSSIFMQMASLNPDASLTAFSACFDDAFADERPYMNMVISAVSDCSQKKVFPDADEFTEDFSKFLYQHDEPVGSASIYAQYLVMREARKNNVPVLLDGQGGDELFSGYWQTYFLLLDSFKKQASYFNLFKHLAGAVLPGGNQILISEIFSGLSEYRKRAGMKFSYTIKQELLDSFATGREVYDTVRKMTPQQYRIHELVNLRLPRLLKWEDRNSMAFSIESRVPFLDINLLEFVLSLNPELNMHAGWTKYLFRKSASDYLPKKICWRKDKKGFETPQSKWMKKGRFHNFLIDWAQKNEHPAAEYIDTNFKSIYNSLVTGTFDSNALFRLFCLDQWLLTIA